MTHHRPFPGSIRNAALLLLVSGSCLATDVAFWKPYTADAQTLLLEHFDAPGAVPGRFGGAHRGPEAWTCPAAALLLSGQVAVECWLNLERLPAVRAFPVRRPATPGHTRGFELFVDPSGALGLAVQGCQGRRSELVSDAGVVPVGEWVHLAAVSIAEAYSVLYRNGREVKRVRLAAGHGLSGDQQKETVAVPIRVGEGVPGLIDEVRVQANVAKFWPRPEQAWIPARAAQPLPPLSQVVASGREPILSLPFEDGQGPAVNQTGVTIRSEGRGVDGVRGQAWRGTLTLAGKPLLTAGSGTLEFWFRPQGINNWSDQNLPLVQSELFSCYLFNSSRHFFRPLTVTHRNPRQATVVSSDGLRTDIFPDQWLHGVFTWGPGRFEWYLNGRKAGSTGAEFANRTAPRLVFNPKAYFGDLDELHLYDQAVSAVEAANLYWRYVDPGRLEPPSRSSPLSFRFWHLPSTRELYLELHLAEMARPAAAITAHLRNPAGRAVFSTPVEWTAAYQRFVLPALVAGDYALTLKLGTDETRPQTLRRQTFAWENNTLGVTDEVFPPFLPVQAAGETVSVVLRQHRMNRFGLWDSVIAGGRELLAAPMRLVALDEQENELPWKGEVRLDAASSARAVYHAAATSPAATLKTVSEIEPDGMMRVTLRLEPPPQPVPVRRLSLEIPLRADEAWLLHEIFDTSRDNYAGALSLGDGEVWNSLQTFRDPAWLNAFTGYVWLGGPERGLAWFAENDRGWITAKNHAAPLLRIVRHGDRVTLRVDLVNVPGPITRATELQFGVQASPTRPLPADYRTKALTLPTVGLSVHPWGGLSCAWKSPWQDCWEVVDKVIAGRNGGSVDRAWFEAFQKQHDVPQVHGVKDWLSDVLRFAGARKPLSSPDPVYFEEMYVLPFIPEYRVFQDEWSLVRLTERDTVTPDIYRNSGGTEVGPRAPVNFTRSYQDYALAYENEWLKRGVSLYWDNLWLKTSLNPWTSAAYVTADGRVQPATTLWNQREYMRRTWNLMNHWRRQGVARPLEFVAHTTNAMLLPLFSWSTCNYDIEMSQAVYANAFPDRYRAGEPYAPEFLLAESVGRQVGAHPYIVHALFVGQCDLPPESLGPAPGPIEIGRREWGMRMVHEINRGGPASRNLPSGLLDKAVYAFGYGSPEVTVWNYWDEAPAFRVAHDQVKALLLARPADRALLLIVQSWSREPVTTTLELRPDVIGFAPGAHVHEAFANRHGRLAGNRLTMTFDFPYETAVFRITAQAPAAETLFADDFDHGLNPGWDHLPFYADVEQGRLRIGENTGAWQGSPRLGKWFGLPDFADAELAFSFGIANPPVAPGDVLTVRFPAAGVAWSVHGASHSDVNRGGPCLSIMADPARGWRLRLHRESGRKTVTLAEAEIGQVDTAMHRLAFAVTAAGQATVTFDGAPALTAANLPLASGNAFGITACGNPAATLGALFLDDIALRAQRQDPEPGVQARNQAKARRDEILLRRTDELEALVGRAFPPRSVPAIRNLGLFRRPESDAAELTQRFAGEATEAQRNVFLALLRELPKRADEHARTMAAIGQPADRLPRFEQARAQVIAFLEARNQTPGGLGQEIARTLEVLKQAEQPR